MAYEPFPFHAGHHVLDTSLNSVPRMHALLRTRREHVGLRARGPYNILSVYRTFAGAYPSPCTYYVVAPLTGPVRFQQM